MPATDEATYLEHCKTRQLSPSTIRAQRLQLDRARKRSRIAFRSWTPDDAWAYMRSLQTDALSARTRACHQSTLSAFFSWLVRQGIKTYNPMADIDRPKLGESTPAHMANSDLTRLLQALPKQGYIARRDRCLLYTLYYCGLRAAEALNLDWEQVDIEEATLRVVGKGNQERIVPIPPQLKEALEAWAQVHPATTGPVFITTTTNTRLGYQALRQTVHDWIEAIGLDPAVYTAHSLRHTFATRLNSRGFPLAHIQKLLGHRQLSTTMLYAKTYIDDDTRDAINRL